MFGGTSITGAVCAVMSKLMTNALAQQYNWIGAATKQSFGRLQLREVICGMSCLIIISTNIGTFSALTLLVGLEGHLACKKYFHNSVSSSL